MVSILPACFLLTLESQGDTDWVQVIGSLLLSYSLWLVSLRLPGPNVLVDPDRLKKNDIFFTGKNVLGVGCKQPISSVLPSHVPASTWSHSSMSCGARVTAEQVTRAAWTPKFLPIAVGHRAMLVVVLSHSSLKYLHFCYPLLVQTKAISSSIGLFHVGFLLIFPFLYLQDNSTTLFADGSRLHGDVSSHLHTSARSLRNS